MTIRSRAKKGFFKTIGNMMEGFGSSSVFSTKTEFPLSTESIAALERDFGTAANVSAANISTDGSQSQSQSFVYYDFATDKNGKKVAEPYHNWNGSMADARSYMKNAGYEENEGAGTLSFSLKDYGDDDNCMVMFMFINNKFFSATVSLTSVDKKATLDWMRSHYKFVESDNEGILDSHTFKSQDNKTNVTVNFMSINGAKPHVTIMYSKK